MAEGRRSGLTGLLLAGLLPWGVAAGEEAPGSLDVAVLYWSMNIPCQASMRAGLEREIERSNEVAVRNGLPRLRLLPRVAGDGGEGIERQIDQFRAAVRAGVDLIIVQPTDNAALARPLQEANAAGIPVVAYDQYISSGSLAAYVTTDNYQAGYLDGEYVAASLPRREQLRVVLVEYPFVSSTVERVDGFFDALATAGRRVDVVARYRAVQPDEGRDAARSLLAELSPEQVDVIFAVNDGGGQALWEELHRAGGWDEVLFASVDGDPAAVSAIRSGVRRGIVSAQFCGPLGGEAARSAVALLRGEAPSRHLLVPPFPVTRETEAGFPGWDGPLPADFHKPWPSRKPIWRGEVRTVSPAGQP